MTRSSPPSTRPIWATTARPTSSRSRSCHPRRSLHTPVTRTAAPCRPPARPRRSPAPPGAAVRPAGSPERSTAPPGGRVHLGDVVVSVERAAEQAAEGRGGQTGDVRWSTADELRLLVTHGALHVCGGDHADPAEERAMRELERHLLAVDRGG